MHSWFYSVSEHQTWSITNHLPMWPSSRQWGSGHLSPRAIALYTQHASAGGSHWSYREELSPREKQQNEYLNTDPKSSKRITGVLFQLVSLKGSYWHPEREENSCKYCTASCCTQASTYVILLQTTPLQSSHWNLMDLWPLHLAEEVHILDLALPVPLSPSNKCI